MIQIQQLRLRPDHTKDDLEKKIRKELGLKDSHSLQYRILRQSVDAHKRPDIFLVYTVEVSLPNEAAVLRRCRNKDRVLRSERKIYRLPELPEGVLSQMQEERPVIIGAGPAGLFCAYVLAHAGLRPLILERGGAVEERTCDVQRFWESGRLDPESNVQFGEGGAGAFSDGKLNSAIKDPYGRVRFVLETFAAFGADSSVCYSYKPHVGTDVLAQVLVNMRREIERLGGTYCFHSRVDRVTRERMQNGTAWLVQVQSGGEKKTIRTGTVVLAIGHSARDTYRMLLEEGLKMEPKSFAVGLRVMHPQKWINDAMYGKDCACDLGAAPYKLTHRTGSGRGVYSFCMCPGGYVVNASSEPGMLAVNGMSYHDRAGENANSAIVVTVSPEDYAASPNDPLSGIAFQRKLERDAFQSAQGEIPVQRFEDYEAGRTGSEPGIVRPCVKGKWRMADVRSILPEELSGAVCEAMHAFGKKIEGFDHPDVLLCGVESRTSSPVRIPRTDTMEAEGFPGIYPCGEGAGYAGGITSAAVDGIKTAEAVLRNSDLSAVLRIC